MNSKKRRPDLAAFCLALLFTVGRAEELVDYSSPKAKPKSCSRLMKML